MSPGPRYAEWRPVAVRRVPAQWIGFVVFLCVAPLGLFVKGGYLWYLLGGYLANLATSRISHRRTQQLRDDPEGDDFAVSLSLKREVGYGHDEGLLSFADGWMVYTGRQCAFSVRREDVVSVIVEAKRLGFQFAGPAGLHTATFVTSELGRLTGKIKNWNWHDEVEGSPIYPPVVPNGEALTVHRYWPVVGLFVATVVLYDITIVSKVHEQWLLGAIAIGLVPVSIAYGILVYGAMRRIAAGLPFRRGRLTKVFSIEPERHPSSLDRPGTALLEKEAVLEQPKNEVGIINR